MSSYPVAYRNALARELGGSLSERGDRFQNPPPPANDNVKPLPTPANDNRPGPLRFPYEQVGKGVALQAGKFALRQFAPRLVPWLGWGLTALDLARWLYYHYHRQSAVQAMDQSYLPGWTLEANCGDHGGSSQWGERSQYDLSCGTKTFLAPVNNNPTVGIGTVLRNGVSWKQQIHWSASTFGFGFCTSGWPSQFWATPSAIAAIYPAQTPVRPYFVEPNFTPNPDPRSDPMSVPVNAPQPRANPKLRPVRRLRPNPWRNPVEQPQRGPVRVAPVGSGRRVVATPSGSRVETVSPVRTPPPSGDKEKKLKTGLPPGVVRKIVDAATEWKDLVDAIYGALPKKLRGRLYWKGLATTPQERALAIYTYWDEIDWQVALQNIVENELEDAVVGGIGKLGAKANKLRGQFAPDGQSGVGVQTGPIF